MIPVRAFVLLTTIPFTIYTFSWIGGRRVGRGRFVCKDEGRAGRKVFG